MISKNNSLYIASLAICLGWLYSLFVSLEAPLDSGDGLMHFFLSQASWENPSLFLDHWGKPLFILFSSPFAQFGFGGMALFNALVFVFTCAFAWKILEGQKTPIFLQICFPFLLLLTPDYSSNILSGLTEPLFGLFLVSACWAWMKEKYFWFAFLVGCLPFLRSEGQLVVLLGLVVLLFNKQWKSTFLVALPFLLYAILGVFVYTDFWWYFTHSPYSMDNHFYGKGHYWHYLIEYKSYLGDFGLLLLLIAFPIALFRLVKKSMPRQEVGLIFLTYGTFLGIIAAHSYFFGTGQNGSMGLTRIATQGLPAFLATNLYLLGSLQIKKMFVLRKLLFLFPVILLVFLFLQPPIHKNTSRINKALLSAGEFIQLQTPLNKQKVYAYHPLLAYALHSNLKMKNQRFQQITGNSFWPEKDKLSYGDIVVWDSQFGPMELEIPLNELMADSNLMLCYSERIAGFSENEGVFLFQYVPDGIKKKVTLSQTKKPISAPHFITGKDEFYTIQEIPSRSKSYVLEITITGNENVHLICESMHHADYQGNELSGAEKTVQYFITNQCKYKLSLWNPEKKLFQVRIKKMVEIHNNFPNLWSRKR